MWSERIVLYIEKHMPSNIFPIQVRTVGIGGKEEKKKILSLSSFSFIKKLSLMLH